MYRHINVQHVKIEIAVVIFIDISSIFELDINVLKKFRNMK